MTDRKPEFSLSAGDAEQEFSKTLAAAAESNIVERIWQKDYTVWNDDPTEISNRLGWLDLPEAMPERCDEIETFAGEIRSAGFSDVLLLGMGGSSLAPEVFSRVFGAKEGYPALRVLDSTHPQAVRELADNLPLENTLFIVSTKSGGTVETLSFFKYFYQKLRAAKGDEAGRHFAAITDPGSGLERLAQDNHFRKIFLNDPNIGGRFSALSYFGLVPAALIGVDIRRLLERAAFAAANTRIDPASGTNRAASLGALMGTLAASGRDKMTLLASPQFQAIGAWIEQLVAESTGKDGKGILPVDLEVLHEPGNYGNDRYFVYLQLKDDPALDARLEELADRGFPVFTSILEDRYDLGAEFFYWEFATALAGWHLNIQPFDQPDVESAKQAARETMAAFQSTGTLPEDAPSYSDEYVNIYSTFTSGGLAEVLEKTIDKTRQKDGGYIAMQAYLKPDSASDSALLAIRTELLRRFGLTVTTGYGPRFLHSTGQLHKGDSGNGVFLQISAETKADEPIPQTGNDSGASMTFGVLIKSQMLGDARALRNKERAVVRIHLKENVFRGLKRILDHLPSGDSNE